MPPPAAPPADASRGPGARATGSNEGPRGTATQPFISVYDQDDDEPWDTPGPPRSADAAGVGPVPTDKGIRCRPNSTGATAPEAYLSTQLHHWRRRGQRQREVRRWWAQTHQLL